MIVWSALIIRILVVTTNVIDEDHLETLWKGCKRHHLSDGHDGRQFLAGKFEISRLQSLPAHAAYIVKVTEQGYSSLVLIFLLVIEVRLFNKDIIFLWWGRGYNKTPLVFQPMECWIIVVYTIGCMVTLKEVHAF